MMATEKQLNNLHPAANLFPMMGEEAFQKLKADIKENGQHESIVMWRDQLLDGRNRLKACRELGIEPDTSELMEDTDPYAWVISHNLHRRHLKPSQLAMVGAKMATLKRGEVGNGRKVDGQNCTSTVDDAASLLNVSSRSIKSAKQVLEHGSQAVIDAVEQCVLPVSLAAKFVIDEPNKKEQSRLVKLGKEAVKEHITEPSPFVDEVVPEATGGDSDIVKVFAKSKTRLNDLREIIGILTDAERTIVVDWLCVQQT